MKTTLRKYEISRKGVPRWQQIQKGLTPEVLGKVLKLAEPTLLLVSPTTRLSKAYAIHTHKVKGQRYEMYVCGDIENNDLWNNGKAKTNKKWKVSIVEGAQNVKQDPKISSRWSFHKKTIYGVTKEWVIKLEAQGLDVMTSADEYLTLVMKSLDEGKPVDSKSYTVLNGKILTKDSIVVIGSCGRYGRVNLSAESPKNSDSHISRLRGSVEVRYA